MGAVVGEAIEQRAKTLMDVPAWIDEGPSAPAGTASAPEALSACSAQGPADRDRSQGPCLLRNSEGPVLRLSGRTGLLGMHGEVPRARDEISASGE
ncbi:hypothetical protein [Actinomyces israelii]|uniref:hypothetical protein n=1 Tax=Actinomyces israelii TaxID=1659 RepID=UPI0005BA8079|nr:hypothetical protein [Actinomyces israelii]